MKSRWTSFLLFSVVVLTFLAALGCGATPTPQVVEKVVQQTVVVKETVKETVVVQQTVPVEKVVEKVVEKPVLITVTPAPTPKDADKSASQVLRITAEENFVSNPLSAVGNVPWAQTWMFMPLFLTDKDGKLLPNLAEKFEVDSTGMVYTIYLFKNAVWSDGSPVTAKDVKEAFELMADPESKDWFGVTLLQDVDGYKDVADKKTKEIKGLEVVDDKTLKIRLTSALGYYPLLLAIPQGGIFKASQAKADPDFYYKKPLVNGPFYPTVAGPMAETAVYAFEQNPKWWGKKPIITRIEGAALKDQQASFLRYEAGESDYDPHLSGIVLSEALKRWPTEGKQLPSGYFFVFAFKPTVEPVDDVNLRLALMHAIDWKKIVDTVFPGGIGKVATNDSLSFLSCAEPNRIAYPFDVAKAKEYLAKSKYGSADKVPKIRLRLSDDPNRKQGGQIIAEMWRTNLGLNNIEMKVTTAEFGGDSGMIAVNPSSQGALLRDAGHYLFGLAHSTQYFSTEFKWAKDDALDKQLQTLLSMKRDDPKFCAGVQEALKKFEGQALMIPFGEITSYLMMKPWVKGMEVNDRVINYTLLDTYIAKH